jgi:hypothetical protein
MHDDDHDDNCRITLTDSWSNDDDDILMDDSQSIAVVDDDLPFEDDTNFDDDDSPFMDDSLNDDDYPLPSHESYQTQYMQPHPNTHSGRMDMPGSSRIPHSFEHSGLPPDIIARLTPAQLSHNPEFMRLYENVQLVQNTLAAYEAHRRRVQFTQRILEWISGVHA